MAYYPSPSYISNYGHVKMGQFVDPEANPRGLGPPPPNAYKRAVLKEPPKQFKVSVLPTKKLGSGWAYGLRVLSTVDDDPTDRKSISSRLGSSHKDYEIWRRWDDCLWFQETLEVEYSIQAREKRRRLEQGKGVKKNGLYLNSKQAASFDSLPPGPDPTSVSLDIHDYIPKLSKKATLFRANQTTIDQRQQQFAALIDALFSPQVPTLIEELRVTRTFKDFFGWWRRDKDFARKHGPDKGKGPQSPTFGSIPFYLDNSNSSQVFSDTASSSQDLPLPRFRSARPTTADAKTPDPVRRSPHDRNRQDVPPRRRRTISAATPSTPAIAVSNASTNGSYESRPSSRASLYSGLSAEISPAVVMWDGQEQLNASDRVSPHALLNAFPQTPMVRETFENIQYPPSPEADSPVLGLEALPEESEPKPPLPQISRHWHGLGPRPPLTRSRGNSVPDSRHRNAIIIPEIVLDTTETPEIPDRSPTTTSTTASPRHSSLFSNASFAPSRRTSASDLPPCPSPRQSLDSCTTDTVDYSSSSPVTPQTPWLSDHDALSMLGPSIKRNYRESVMSIDSVMTDASVDQVLPRSTPRRGDFSAMRSFSPGPRSRPLKFVPMSVPEEEAFLEDYDDGVLESYLYGIEEMDASGEPESVGKDHYPHRECPSQHPTSEQLLRPFQNRPPGKYHLPWTSTPHSPSSINTPGPPISPVSVTSMGAVSHEIISIKAYITEEAIIVFRAAAETTYAEIRERIFEKFAHQEGISLRPDFPLAYLAPAFSRHSTTSSVYSGIMRKRAGKAGSPKSNESSLLLIHSQEVWEEVMRDSDGKLTLRVFE